MKEIVLEQNKDTILLRDVNFDKIIVWCYVGSSGEKYSYMLVRIPNMSVTDRFFWKSFDGTEYYSSVNGTLYFETAKEATIAAINYDRTNNKVLLFDSVTELGKYLVTYKEGC